MESSAKNKKSAANGSASANGNAAANGSAVCMIRGCGREAHSRGLCRACYQAFRVIVRQNEATEEELVGAGMVEPCCQTPIRRQLEELRRKQLAAAK